MDMRSNNLHGAAGALHQGRQGPGGGQHHVHRGGRHQRHDAQGHDIQEVRREDV